MVVTSYEKHLLWKINWNA